MTTLLRFDQAKLTRPPTAGLDVVTTLRHFAIVTYMVEPQKLRSLMPERFVLDCITAQDGTQKALLSVVPFFDRGFHLAKFPWVRQHFGQTNYRVYVTDRQTGEHVVWFLGVSLATWAVVVPRYGWQLPWHHAEMVFDVAYAEDFGRYTRYKMHTRSRWGAADLELTDSGQPPQTLQGFPDLEHGLVLLTHPLRGFYYRRDGQLGSYTIWHDRLRLTVGQATTAKFAVLDRLGLVQAGDLTGLHSVLIQPETQFTIYLPPKIVEM